MDKDVKRHVQKREKVRRAIRNLRESKVTEVFSARLTLSEQEKFEEEAQHRGMTKTGLLRYWIRGAASRRREVKK
jgi:hypothetical protein